MKDPVKLPALPAVNSSDPALSRWLMAATERMEVREGSRGPADEKTVLLRDLDGLGLAEIGAGMLTGGKGMLHRRPDGSVNFLDAKGLSEFLSEAPTFNSSDNSNASLNIEVIAERVRQLALQGINDDSSARKTDIAKLQREIIGLTEEGFFVQAGTGALKRKYQAKLREQRVSVQDYTGGIVPAATSAEGWYWDYTNADGASNLQMRSNVPSTVSLVGGGGVQGAGLIFNGQTSAQTPNAGLAETNMIRMFYEVKPAAGSKVQVHLINGLLVVGNEGNNIGNENAFILGTTRAVGPLVASGGVNAVGVWAADFHSEKASGVADGAMVGLEVGMHKGPGLGSYRNTGIDLWSGDRSGIIASRAGDALQIHGNAGWTNYLKFLYTDQVTEVVQLNQFGQLVLRAPIIDQSVLFTSNQPNTASTLQVTGYTSGSVNVTAFMQAQPGGQISLGAISNHPVVMISNNSEVARFLANLASVSTASGNQVLRVNTVANNTTAALQVRGRDSGGTEVRAILDAQAGGQVTIGCTTGQDVVLVAGSEVLRFVPNFIFSTPSSAQQSGGTGTALLSTNCPAGNPSSPTTWLRVRLSGGLNGFMPVWV